MAPAYSAGATKIEVVMTKIEELATELYKKKTAIIEITATAGVSANRMYSILSEHDIPLHSGQKAFRRIIAFDVEVKKPLQQANPANISAWVYGQIKENNR